MWSKWELSQIDPNRYGLHLRPITRNSGVIPRAESEVPEPKPLKLRRRRGRIHAANAGGNGLLRGSISFMGGKAVSISFAHGSGQMNAFMSIPNWSDKSDRHTNSMTRSCCASSPQSTSRPQMHSSNRLNAIRRCSCPVVVFKSLI
jgi:hypothetical protein